MLLAGAPVPDAPAVRSCLLLPRTRAILPPLLAAALMALPAACRGGDGTPDPTPAPGGAGPAAAATAAPPPGSVEVVASGTAFNVTTVTARAGETVTVVFRNRDTVPHRLAFYRGPDGEPIARGDVIAGGQSDTVAFQAPSQPGVYHFQCDVHPDRMSGRFEVR